MNLLTDQKSNPGLKFPKFTHLGEDRNFSHFEFQNQCEESHLAASEMTPLSHEQVARCRTPLPPEAAHAGRGSHRPLEARGVPAAAPTALPRLRTVGGRRAVPQKRDRGQR